eukprot:COSAG01_NODE_69096_length_262_cov_0.840491_1_plen_28_part_01
MHCKHEFMKQVLPTFLIPARGKGHAAWH